MIFVILGTQKFPFVRLLEKLDELKQNRVLNEEIIVQAGYTKFDSDQLNIIDFMNKELYEETISKANLIITHGGTGAIINSLKKQKKVIAIPRLAQYGEHVDDHQNEIIGAFTMKNYIMRSDCTDLEECIKKIDSYNFNTYESNNDKFIDMIASYLTDSYK